MEMTEISADFLDSRDIVFGEFFLSAQIIAEVIDSGFNEIFKGVGPCHGVKFSFSGVVCALLGLEESGEDAD